MIAVSVFRDAQTAAAAENEALRAEVERLRAENAILRGSVGALSNVARPRDPRGLYFTGTQWLTDGERVMLGEHQLQRFPAWLAALLHVLTFGLFSIFHFGAMHGRLPRVAADDPSAGRAVGLMFVPYFNFYWGFFSPLRLADRINLQFDLRGDPRRVARAPIIVGAVASFFFYFVPIAWVIAVWQTQQRVNELVALGPVRANAMAAMAEEPARTGVRVDAAWEERAEEYMTSTATAEEVGADGRRGEGRG